MEVVKIAIMFVLNIHKRQVTAIFIVSNCTGPAPLNICPAHTWKLSLCSVFPEHFCLEISVVKIQLYNQSSA